MVICRAPSLTSSESGMARSPPAAYAAKDRADRQSEAGEITFAENISGHHFTGGENIFRRLIALHDHTRLLVYGDAEIGKRNSRSKRIPVEGRRIDGACPVTFYRIEAFGSTIIQFARIEMTRTHGSVEVIHGSCHSRSIDAELRRKLSDRARIHRGKYRRHEERQCLGIDDGIGNLIRLLGDELAPDRIPLRPEVLAFIVEALRCVVDGDAEGHAVEPRDDAAVELGRAGVERHGVAAARIADGFCAMAEQLLQHPALVLFGAANDEIISRVAPIFLE